MFNDMGLPFGDNGIREIDRYVSVLAIHKCWLNISIGKCGSSMLLLMGII
jgi:hypothetical protein